MNQLELIEKRLQESIEVKLALLKQDKSEIIDAVDRLVGSLRAGGKILLFGNGGSAADAQHIAAEFVNRFSTERGPLPAVALTTDTSILTSIGNDLNFDEVYARQVEAFAAKNDVVIAISTSGNSRNVLRGVEVARARGIATIGLTGRDGGELKDLVDICLHVPSDSTPRIQEAHIAVLFTSGENKDLATPVPGYL